MGFRKQELFRQGRHGPCSTESVETVRILNATHV
jgi:hypothetical protein